MLTIGTCNFVDLHAARRYYAPYGYTTADVADLIKEGSIRIGMPTLADNELLSIIPDEGRYAITYADS